MVEDDTTDDMDAEDVCLECVIEEAVQCEIQNRLMIRTIVGFLQSRRSEPDQSKEVQRHLDCAAIAAAMRLERIFSSDRRMDPIGDQG
jgi:hypothetical protein